MFSFKVRGAYNKMAQHVRRRARARRNHRVGGQSCAGRGVVGGTACGVKAIIVVPVTTPQVKVDAVRAHGGPTVEVVQFGESFSDALRPRGQATGRARPDLRASVRRSRT